MKKTKIILLLVVIASILILFLTNKKINFIDYRDQTSTTTLTTPSGQQVKLTTEPCIGDEMVCFGSGRLLISSSSKIDLLSLVSAENIKYGIVQKSTKINLYIVTVETENTVLGQKDIDFIQQKLLNFK